MSRVNQVQAICLRPRMYTANGTLTEVVNLIVGKAGKPVAGSLERASIIATVNWLKTIASDPADVVAEMLEKFDTDEDAIHAIYEFASQLPED